MKLDDGIDKLFLLRERKRGLEDQIKEVNSEFKELHDELLQTCDDVGTTTARGTVASIAVTETLVPKIEDWGLAAEWIIANDALYLCHRRISSGPWKELRDSGKNVPGITPYTKRAISLRKLGD